jgi:cyclic pyranopterin phosphate synthase
MSNRTFPTATPPLIDPFGRAINYLRVSVTDRCDLRCVYCMSEDMNFLPKRDVLTLEELDRLSSAFIALGTRKLRITGGEPLVRRDIMRLFRSLSRHLVAGALDELTLTTNGSQLARFASELADCGVRRVNVSLDTLDAKKFRAITRWGDLDKVTAGVEAAQAAGLAVKVNVVALKGVNDEEAFELVEWAHGRGMELTFIEVMPLGEIEIGRADQYLPLTELRAKLSTRLTLTPSPFASGGPARYYDVAETKGRVGFITPLTHNFCESCNRVRVTCTGTLYMCLGQEDAADLRSPLRQSESDEALNSTIRSAIARKPRGHDFMIDRASRVPAVARHMSVTGG